MTLATTSRTCSVCRPTRILCCCGYEALGKRRIRRPLADGELSARAQQFRLRRKLLEGLSPVSRRRVSELLRLWAAIECGPSQPDQDAADALWRTIRTRDDGRDGYNAVRWAERRFLALYLDEWIGELKRREALALDPPQEPDARPGCYYVHAVGGAVSNAGHRDPGAWLVAGPYETHAEALALVADVKREACARDRRGDMLAWGTVRMETAEASLLGVWRPEPPADAGQVEAQETHATAPRKPAKARKGRKPSAGPGGAGDASQGQPGAAGEAPAIDPAKQAAWERGELTRAEAVLRTPSEDDITISSCCAGPALGSDG